MAGIRAIRAFRYSTRLRKQQGKLLTPPYDVIDADLQQELYDRHPKNFVRLDLGKDAPGDNGAENKYKRAARAWAGWNSEGTIEQDAKASLYAYEQEFDLPGSGRRRRRGFFCAVKLEDFEGGSIHAHERTFEGPKADRLNLMRSTRCNFSPIFSIYDDPDRTVDRTIDSAIKGREAETTHFDGIVHRLWAIDDESAVTAVTEAISAMRLFIADGHHRYETCLNYRDEERARASKTSGEEPFDYTLMFLANARAEGVEILPTHRALRAEAVGGLQAENLLPELAANFNVRPIDVPEDPTQAAEKVMPELIEAGRTASAFVLVFPNGPCQLLTLREGADLDSLIDDPDMPDSVKRLDVTLLHRHIIPKAWPEKAGEELGHDDVSFIKDAAEVLRVVKAGQCAVGFLMNPTKMEEVIGIAGAGARMPQKSTYFYPKIATGLVIRDLAAPW